MDIEHFKEAQKAMWSGFAALELFTGTAAPKLVAFAGATAGRRVLDVGCGTGVVALTAARQGAWVTGVDLTPALVAHARENAALARVEIDFHEGDAEALAFADASFDVVVSQFAHMFAPRPEVATREMLRVLKPGGTIAFSTWPPELFVGALFNLMGKHGPPPPPGAVPASAWGDPNVARERLGDGVRGVTFDRAVLRMPMLSPQHGRDFFERTLGPMGRLVQSLEAAPEKLGALRADVEALITIYFEDNTMRQDFLMTRAVKRDEAGSAPYG